LEETAGRVIVQLLLPRGDNFRLPALCPPRCDIKKKPFKSYMPAVDKVNAAILKQKKELDRLHPGRLSIVDCNAPFVGTGGKEVKVELMPDTLHPNAAGHKLLATCLLDCIKGKSCSTT